MHLTLEAVRVICQRTAAGTGRNKPVWELRSGRTSQGLGMRWALPITERQPACPDASGRCSVSP